MQENQQEGDRKEGAGTSTTKNTRELWGNPDERQS